MLPALRSLLRPAVAAFCVLLVLASCSAPAPDASGEELYGDLCARCHGGDLQGGVGPPLGPGSSVQDETDEYIATTIARGRGRMPAFGGSLSDDQIERLVELIRRHQAGEAGEDAPG